MHNESPSPDLRGLVILPLKLKANCFQPRNTKLNRLSGRTLIEIRNGQNRVSMPNFNAGDLSRRLRECVFEEAKSSLNVLPLEFG